jgi:UDPglucose 6-dehydrogenase
MKVGIIGLGFVGNSMLESFKLLNIQVSGYDKFKEGGIGTFEEMLNQDILFLALPTPYSEVLKKYNYGPIEETLKLLKENNYQGICVLKSTVQPKITYNLEEKYGLPLIHNPEFLTARTAFEDFHNQKHIVLGSGKLVLEEQYNLVKNFYQLYYPNAEISECTSLESESMKIFCNSFYAVKVQFFTELYCLCQKNNSDYNKIKDMMLKNNWINPMHTTIPGPDGNISYGGLCFPKDTNALQKYMEELNSPNLVLSGCIIERNQMREDHDNIEKLN